MPAPRPPGPASPLPGQEQEAPQTQCARAGVSPSSHAPPPRPPRLSKQGHGCPESPLLFSFPQRPASPSPRPPASVVAGCRKHRCPRPSVSASVAAIQARRVANRSPPGCCPCRPPTNCSLDIRQRLLNVKYSATGAVRMNPSLRSSVIRWRL